jgi:hypothetical protein
MLHKLSVLIHMIHVITMTNSSSIQALLKDAQVKIHKCVKGGQRSFIVSWCEDGNWYPNENLMQEILPLEKREAEDGTSTTIMLALQKPSNNFIGIHICKVAHEIHGSESPVCTTHAKMLRHQGIEIRFLNQENYVQPTNSKTNSLNTKSNCWILDDLRRRNHRGNKAAQDKPWPEDHEHIPTSSLEFNSWERKNMQEGGRKKKKKASPSVFILWKENSTHKLYRDMMWPTCLCRSTYLIKRLDVIHMLLQMQSGHSYWYPMCVVSTPVWLVLFGFKQVRRGFVF